MGYVPLQYHVAVQIKLMHNTVAMNDVGGTSIHITAPGPTYSSYSLTCYSSHRLPCLLAIVVTNWPIPRHEDGVGCIYLEK